MISRSSNLESKRQKQGDLKLVKLKLQAPSLLQVTSNTLQTTIFKKDTENSSQAWKPPDENADPKNKNSMSANR